MENPIKFSINININLKINIIRLIMLIALNQNKVIEKNFNNNRKKVKNDKNMNN